MANYKEAVAVVLASVAVVPAMSQPVDNYAARDIATARYDVAIAQLQQVVREDALDEGALLNLALIHRQRGQTVEATRLYRRVLANEDSIVGTMDGKPRSAHTLAREGLSKMVTFASR